MIHEVKRTPITFNGVDGWEILVKNDDIMLGSYLACDRCMFQDWSDDEEFAECCHIVHNCTMDFQKYFIFEPFST